MNIISNYDWNFEYNPKKSIFKIDEKIVDDKLFKFNDATDYDYDVDFRKAAFVHKLTRKHIQKFFKSGTKIKNIVNETENFILKLFKENSAMNSEKGIAFPVGVSINNCVAHDSCCIQDDREFKKGDVVKFDFGTHVNGNIIDSAFTTIIDEEESIYDNLLYASSDATYTAISMSGPDARLLELSEIIEEVISSYQLPEDSKLKNIDIKPVKGIGGHNILPYKIHGDKFIFSSPDKEAQGDLKMKDGEVYAIETYATNGSGLIKRSEDLNVCTHFMENTESEKLLFLDSKIHYDIKKRNNLPFTLNWCDIKDNTFFEKFRHGVIDKSISVFPPLFDNDDESKVSQFEHTIKIKENNIEIYSLGEDY